MRKNTTTRNIALARSIGKSDVLQKAPLSEAARLQHGSCANMWSAYMYSSTLQQIASPLPTDNVSLAHFDDSTNDTI